MFLLLFLEIWICKDTSINGFFRKIYKWNSLNKLSYEWLVVNILAEVSGLNNFIVTCKLYIDSSSFSKRFNEKMMHYNALAFSKNFYLSILRHKTVKINMTKNLTKRTIVLLTYEKGYIPIFNKQLQIH